MKTKSVIVLPYDRKWKDAFIKIKEELDQKIGNDIISIEHVGSTSVEGLAAKPIIDIDIVIEISIFDQIKTKLESIGYKHEGDLGISGREAFKYENKEHLMRHHLYVCDKENEELYKHIVFRNWLKENPDDRDMYSKVKLEMATKYPTDIDAYIDGKSPCIRNIYKRCGLIT
ncbi:MAG: hypothetical protein K0S47_2126 [Herbinix sp.]|jgi:GrpB-like predicted nucleotidyltransferase (UPF0157 family)|nr:hypothetical protein [Herbinix sp.]